MVYLVGFLVKGKGVLVVVVLIGIIFVFFWGDLIGYGDRWWVDFVYVNFVFGFLWGLLMVKLLGLIFFLIMLVIESK